MDVKYEIGQVTKKSIYLARSNLSSAKNAYSKASVSYEDAQRSLELLLGRYPSALIQASKINKFKYFNTCRNTLRSIRKTS